MSSLFPITEYWSWGTFLLYLIVSISVCRLCKCGARWKCKEKTMSYGRKSNNIFCNSSMYYFLAFCILVAVGTLRTTEVGTDTPVYIGYFNTIRAFNFSFSKLFSFNQMEPGFQLYLSLIHRISDNYTFLFFVNSLLMSAAYIKYIKCLYDENTDYTFLQIFIFYYVSNLSGMRAALATVFLLYSFINLAEDKYIKASIFTLIACSFHYTMIFNFYIIITMILFKTDKLKRKKWLWIILLIFIGIFAMLSINVLRGVFAGTKYSYYTDKLENQSLLGSLFIVLYGLFSLGAYRAFMNEEKYSGKFRKIFVTSLAFLITYPVIFITGAYRIPNYYIMPRLTVWSKMKTYYEGRIKQKQLFHLFIQVIVIIYLFFRFTRSSINGGFIYHWIL